MASDAADPAHDQDVSNARIFISYSRTDMAFTDRLEAALRARGFAPLIDRSDIYAFEKWWPRIEALIAQADTIVFVLSPAAVASKVCGQEVEFAAGLNKRFAPIVCRSVDAAAVPEALRQLNFISFEDGEHFDDDMRRLAEALETDIAWVRKHTEFGEHARRWLQAGRPGPRGLLLRSPMLEEAERWIASRPPGAPVPTEWTQAYIAQSRRAATQRRNILSASLGAGLVVAFALAGFAEWQRGQAVEQRERAIAQEQLATKNEAQAKAERDRAQLVQSRFLADLSQQRHASGDSATAIALALEGLPDAAASNTRPYAPEAELALFQSWQSLLEISVIGANEKNEKDVKTAAFSADGRRVVTGSWDDDAARVWDAETGGSISVLRGHTAAINSVAFSVDRRRAVTASDDRTARVWDPETGRTIAVLTGHADKVSTATFSADGRRVVTASDDTTARVWDAESGRAIVVLKGHAGAVQSAKFSTDGRRVLTTSGDHTMRVWDAETGKLMKALQVSASPLLETEFSADGRRVVATYSDVTASVWNVETGKVTVTLKGHAGEVLSAALSADGRRVVTGSKDSTARI